MTHLYINTIKKIFKGGVSLDKRLIEILGIFLGSVQGFILAKVYQIWAVLYHMEGFRLAGKDGWRDTPIWVFSKNK